MFRPGNNCCGNEAGLVQKFIGSAYDIVKNVHDNLEEIKFIFDFMAKYDVLLCVESVEELKQVNWKSSKFVRMYLQGNGSKTYVDYIYAPDDKSGVLPDHSQASGSWVKVDTLLGAGGSNSIPWLYNNGSANGGEVSIHVEEDAIGVSEIFINGLRKHLGIGYTYEPVSRTIQLPTALAKGDQLVAKLIGYPALPNTPNISEFMFVNWVYNNGTAIGGETKLKPPYTFQKVPAVFINGLRKLENRDYVAGYSDYSINLTLPLKANDVVIVQLGGEADAFSIDVETAREALRRTYAEAGLVLVDGSFEDGAKVITKQDVVLERKMSKVYNWQGIIPSGGKVIPAGSTPSSAGGIGIDRWQDLSNITYANQREFANDKQYTLYRSFEAAVTLTQVNEAVQFSAGGMCYRWDGVFPSGGLVIPQNTPDPISSQTGEGKYVAVLDLTVKDALLRLLASSRGSSLIGFSVSPVTRTVQDKIREILSVKDYGGYEGGDLSAPVQAMLDAALQGQHCYINVNGYFSKPVKIPTKNGLKIITTGAVKSDITDYIFQLDPPNKTYTRNIEFVGGAYDVALFLRVNDPTQLLKPDADPTAMGYVGHIRLDGVFVSSKYRSEKPIMHLTKCPQARILNVAIDTCYRGLVLEGCDLPYIMATGVTAFRKSGIELVARDASFGASGKIEMCELLSPRLGGIGIISSDRDVRIRDNYFEPTIDPDTQQPADACIRIELPSAPGAQPVPPKIDIQDNRIDGARNDATTPGAVKNWLYLDVAPLRATIVNNRSTVGFVGKVRWPAKVTYWYNPVDRRYITAHSNNPSDEYPMTVKQCSLAKGEFARYNPNLDGVLYSSAVSTNGQHWVENGAFIMSKSSAYMGVNLRQYGVLPDSVNVWILARTRSATGKITVLDYDGTSSSPRFTKYNLTDKFSWVNVGDNRSLSNSNARLEFSNEDAGNTGDIEIKDIVLTN